MALVLSMAMTIAVLIWARLAARNAERIHVPVEFLRRADFELAHAPVLTHLPTAVMDAIRHVNAGDAQSGVIFTFLSRGALPMWRKQLRLVQQLRLNSVLQRWLLVSWDGESHAECCARLSPTHCVLDSNLLSTTLRERGAQALLDGGDTWQFEERWGATQHELYARMRWRRVEVAAAALHAGIHVVGLDSDVMVFRDPFPSGAPPTMPPAIAANGGVQAPVGMDFYGIVSNGEEHFNRTCATFGCEGQLFNAGAWFARATPRTIRMINHTLHRQRDLTADDNEQETYGSLLGWHAATRGLATAVIDPILAQGDALPFDRYGTSMYALTASICDKVLVHASNCGELDAKLTRMDELANNYLAQCIDSTAVLQSLATTIPPPPAPVASAQSAKVSTADGSMVATGSSGEMGAAARRRNPQARQRNAQASNVLTADTHLA